MRRKGIITLVIILIFGLVGSIPVFAQEGRYTLVPLGDLKGPNTYPYDINDSGQVVGKADTDIIQEGRVWKAFTWTKGCMGQAGCLQPLFPNETYRSSANAINSVGMIAGYRNGSAFLFEGNGGVVNLGIFPQDASSWGLAINNTNKVAGFGSNEGSAERGALWEKAADGRYTPNDIGNLGGNYTRATSVNDADQIVGFTSNADGFARAFRWQKVNGSGTMIDLGVLQSFTDSYATRINKTGEAVGYSLKYENAVPVARACLWNTSGITELKVKNAAGDFQSSEYSEAYGLNDSTVVVGMQLVGAEFRAFIWDAQNGMRDLNALIPEGSGWVLEAATAINNNGEIVGYGYANGSGNYSAFLLIPPPSENNEDPAGPLKVGIDIRPWNSHNHINQHSWWGLVPVAILSTPDFNAVKDVDRKSLTFGPTGDETHAAFCMAGARDVNRDRQKDLICYFHERPAEFQCGNTMGIVKGKTKKGEEFKGEDSVQVVPCPPPKKHHKGR